MAEWLRRQTQVLMDVSPREFKSHPVHFLTDKLFSLGPSFADGSP